MRWEMVHAIFQCIKSVSLYVFKSTIDYRLLKVQEIQRDIIPF